MESCSRLIGLLTKSKAPSFIALTGRLHVAEGRHDDDGHLGIGGLDFLEHVRPWMSGRRRSSSTRSGGSFSTALRASFPSAAVLTTYPSSVSAFEMKCRIRLLVVDDQDLRDH
jgi:hypothetical protein